jgi:ribosomal protein S18 acetylase RimI-like enzyme
LGVAPVVRRRGVARRLLNRMTALFIDEGARMMILDTEVQNEAAMNFFESQGFGNKVEHVYLSQNLASHPEYIRKRKERKKAESSNDRRKKRGKKKSIASVRARRPAAGATQGGADDG